jgi:hypothetical protein
MLIGGGDTLTCSVALKTILYTNIHNTKHFMHLYNKYKSDKEIKVKAMPGTLYHLYHNTAANRQYTTRYSIINKYLVEDTKYKSLEDMVYKNNDGVYEWNVELREELNECMLNYFSSRYDDDVDTSAERFLNP